MRLADYPEFVRSIIKYPQDKWEAYCRAAMASEVGEYIGKTAKHIRGDYPEVDEYRKARLLELGDILYTIVATASHFGIEDKDIVEMLEQKATSECKHFADSESTLLFRAFRFHDLMGNDRETAAMLIIPDLADSLINELARFNYTMNDCVVANWQKLSSRVARGTLKGDGDNR